MFILCWQRLGGGFPCSVISCSYSLASLQWNTRASKLTEIAVICSVLEPVSAFPHGLCINSHLQIPALRCCLGCSWWWSITLKPNKPSSCFCSVFGHSCRDANKDVSFLFYFSLFIASNKLFKSLVRGIELGASAMLSTHSTYLHLSPGVYICNLVIPTSTGTEPRATLGKYPYHWARSLHMRARTHTHLLKQKPAQ